MPTEDSSVPSVLFVCLGNICRSPAAEDVVRAAAERAGVGDRVAIDSAGTGAWHVGERADRRMRAAARTRGIELTSRARQIELGDLERFDLIVAMDRENLRDIESLAAERPGRSRAEVRLLSSFLGDGAATDVPDPYYGGTDGFEVVLDMLERAAPAILDRLVTDARR